MDETRTVTEVPAPKEPIFPGSALVGTVLFPVFAVVALALGFLYEMPWLITSSLAISLALASVLASNYLNRRNRSGKLRLTLRDGATWIGPAPSSRLLPLLLTSLAALVVLADLVLRLTGNLIDEGGMSFTVMLALIVVWGLVDGYYVLKNPPGLELSPTHLKTVASMGKETRVPWPQVNAQAFVKGARLLIPVGPEHLQVGVNQIDSDPRLVIALLDAYRNRPARQNELGDGRVVERAQSLTVR